MVLQDLCEKINENNHENIKKIIGNILNEKFNTKDFTIKIFLEKVSQNNLIIVDDAKKDPNSQEDSSIPTLQNSVFVDFRTLVNPIDGKSLREVQANEYLKVQLLLTTPISNSIARTYSMLNSDGKIMPTVVKVLQIKYSQNNIELLVELSNGIYGYITEESNILVKIPTASEIKAHIKVNKERNPLENNDTNDSENNEQDFSFKNPMAKIYILLSVLTLALLVVFWVLIAILNDF